MTSGTGLFFYFRFYGRMNDLFLKILLLMATETEVTAGGYQKVVVLGGMGVVALDAFAGLQG
jgi:hypothetical protein